MLVKLSMLLGKELLEGRGPGYMVQPLWKIHASGCNYLLAIISVQEKATHLTMPLADQLARG
jgi:hypothetical protein